MSEDCQIQIRKTLRDDINIFFTNNVSYLSKASMNTKISWLFTEILKTCENKDENKV